MDGVSHESEATEGSLCSIFKILYDLRCSSDRLCSADERSRKRQREKAIFPPAAVPVCASVIFFYEVTECTATDQPRILVYSIDICQTVFGFYYFSAYRTGVDLQSENPSNVAVRRA